MATKLTPEDIRIIANAGEGLYPQLEKKGKGLRLSSVFVLDRATKHKSVGGFCVGDYVRLLSSNKGKPFFANATILYILGDLTYRRDGSAPDHTTFILRLDDKKIVPWNMDYIEAM